MAKRNEATELLMQGLTLDRIAEQMKVSFQTMSRYMKLQVAEGALKVSDVFFGLAQDRRETLEKLLLDNGDPVHPPTKAYYRLAAEQGISWDEANLYWSLRDSRFSRGDMYEHLADVEVELHAFIRRTLEGEFGSDETGWWRKGVPVSVRKSCVQAREDDPDPIRDTFAYTTFINLSEIIDKNWVLFCPKFPKQWAANRKGLISDLARLNQIRNAVMHPVKKRRWNEQDFDFVESFLETMRTSTGVRILPNKALQRTVRFASNH